jgi:RNA polymerase sigma factor (sigma-70 family)
MSLRPACRFPAPSENIGPRLILAREDLTSNVFLAAFRHLGRFRWRRIPFRAWLYRIATNEIRMYYRRQKRSRVIPLDVSNDDLPGDGPSARENLSMAEDHTERVGLGRIQGVSQVWSWCSRGRTRGKNRRPVIHVPSRAIYAE